MKKNQMIIISVVIIVLVLGTVLLIRNSQTQKKSEITPTPTEEQIPTVDSSVKVDLLAVGSGKEVTLSIAKIPVETSTIEYSLSYNTKQQGIQGVIGTVNVTSNKNEYEKTITLGTCSSGRCVYHDVEGAIKLTLKFSGNYGDRIFEKDFTL